MTDSTRYDVVFQGVPVDSPDAHAVKVRLAHLFKLDPAKVEALCAQASVRVKRDVDGTAAERYCRAVRATGALCAVVAVESAVAPAPPPATVAATNAALGGADLAPAGATLVTPAEVVPPEFDLSGLTMDEPGADLVTHAPRQAPQIDTDHMTLSPAGATLVEHEPVVTPEIDTSALSMDSD
ncbi:MAG: hypothetical protein P8076_07010 [Gammaproteobacteria bacterium]